MRACRVFTCQLVGVDTAHTASPSGVWKHQACRACGLECNGRGARVFDVVLVACLQSVPGIVLLHEVKRAFKGAQAKRQVIRGEVQVFNTCAVAVVVKQGAKALKPVNIGSIQTERLGRGSCLDLKVVTEGSGYCPRAIFPVE